MSEFTPTQKRIRNTLLGAVAATGVAVGAGNVIKDDNSNTESLKTTTPVEQEANKTTTTMDVSTPLDTEPSQTTVTVEAPTTTTTQSPTTTEKPAVKPPVKSGENELEPQSKEQVLAQLAHPKIGDKFQENILFTTLNLSENSTIYSAPDANASHLASQAGGVTNAVLLDGKYACFNMTPDNTNEQTDLIVGCVDVQQEGVDLDVIQKGSMTVEQILEDGRGYGMVNGELQVVAAFNSTANDTPSPR